MAVTAKRLGYCRDCMRNVEHRRVILIWALRPISWLLWPLFYPLGIGPWYCFQCGRAKLRLPALRRGAPTEEIQRAKPDSEFVPAGNWLKENSLLVRAAQNSRFTRKFRFGTVEKVIAGGVPLEQIAQDLNVTNSDIAAWICEFYQTRVQTLAEENERLVTLIRQFMNAVSPRIAEHQQRQQADPQYQPDEIDSFNTFETEANPQQTGGRDVPPSGAGAGAATKSPGEQAADTDSADAVESTGKAWLETSDGAPITPTDPNENPAPFGGANQR